jgi:hypothetical protein
VNGIFPEEFHIWSSRKQKGGKWSPVQNEKKFQAIIIAERR